ncbi:acylglycerol lipase [Galdieria sulphuraria]|uniref:Acylglycerol lipase n=1 Tax=Galdieria sulphuraria TaxID=130081 RepID=M2XFR6_GALSU|nr:acylglycerol lipase [Galdieria sulphuraria]EME28857.1 acylglycerol lipase [Galdieria sulphuraria]|eukprot:XP_005705377.1 acylglycerol lipase [Galdieria sulphuraria]
MLDFLQGKDASTIQPKACVFLIHGLHSNTFCEYLEPDPSQNSARRLYQNSIPQLLNGHGFVVFAHDHQGHGKSQGKCKGYFNSMDTLVADTYQYMEWITKEKYPVLKEKPLFLIGCSMGSLVSILLGLKYESLLRGAVLISPAVSQASNQFGVMGRILRPLSGIVSTWYPTLPVLRLPKNEKFPELQKSWDNDELNYHGKLRARVGEQFMKTYDELSEKATLFSVPFIMYYGSEDTLVDPKGMQSFFDKVASSDKKVVLLEGRWHILHHEPGKESVRQQFLQWMEERC